MENNIKEIETTGNMVVIRIPDLSSKSQTEQHPKIVLTHGVQGGVVGCELLDKDGNLWFSIKGEGAYRYDGTTFTTFSKLDDQPDGG